MPRNTTMTGPRPTLGAIAVVVHEQRVLLVQRKKDPDSGLWGFPGGHVELGETALAAAARELTEETGVIATPARYLTNIDVITRDAAGLISFHFLLAVVLCQYQAGTPLASEEVKDARWFTMSEIDGLRKSARVREMITLALSS